MGMGVSTMCATTVFEKIKSTDSWMDAKLNSITHKTKVFQCFELFRARLAYKFSKSANMTSQTFSKIFLIWVSKNTEFDADFESVKKSIKKVFSFHDES